MKCWSIVTILTFWNAVVSADHEFMVNSPENVIVPTDYETQLLCEMNIPPDKFLWLYYPLENKDRYNSNAILDLNKKSYILNPSQAEDSKSVIKVKVQENSKDVAGDYQCLAIYGASVIASVPSRITIATLGNFTSEIQTTIDVVPGNTILWRCDLPFANPAPEVDYYKNNDYVIPTELSSKIKALLIENISSLHSGIYRCSAKPATYPKIISKETLTINVLNYASPKAPYFITRPKKVYTTTQGESVFLECAAIGNPVPKVSWYKFGSELPANRTELVRGGLKINKITNRDEGVYICNHTNSYGSSVERITVVYNEAPTVECYSNTTEVKQNEKLDLECAVKGVPEPQVTWFLNGNNVRNDSAIEAIGNKIYFSSVEKRHAGNLQLFATNSIKTVYDGISIRVIPIASSENTDDYPSIPHRHGGRKPSRKPPRPMRPPKMIPPNKPTVTRLNDHAVVIRWSVNTNNGLPISFFKVQYRELGPVQNTEHYRGKGSKWKTCNEDIAPHIRSYEVNNLKSDHIYRFRIAAVYSNNDNNFSSNSDKFYLRRMDFDEDNKPSIPIITNTESINSTAVRIYWKCSVTPNKTIDGYYISFISASRAGDPTRVSVDGADTSSYILGYLQPDTVYDIKLQSFNSRAASEYSQTMKAKTLVVSKPELSVYQGSSTVAPVETKSGGNSQMYILMTIVVLAAGLLLASIAVLIGCRKWKQKKNAECDRHKPTVEEHHIQADGNEYVVTPRSLPRTNGCVMPNNRITITSNPLADTENKSQNVIELTCLTSQNNNTTQSTDDTSSNTAERKKHKSRSHKNKLKQNKSSPPPGENYV